MINRSIDSRIDQSIEWDLSIYIDRSSMAYIILLQCSMAKVWADTWKCRAPEERKSTGRSCHHRRCYFLYWHLKHGKNYFTMVRIRREQFKLARDLDEIEWYIDPSIYHLYDIYMRSGSIGTRDARFQYIYIYIERALSDFFESIYLYIYIYIYNHRGNQNTLAAWDKWG